MLRIFGRTAASVRRFARSAGQVQGLLGVATLAAGVFILAGVGWALVVVGGFLLIGAWGSR